MKSYISRKFPLETRITDQSFAFRLAGVVIGLRESFSIPTCLERPWQGASIGRLRYYRNQRSQEALTKAIEYFQLATEKDPNYTLAYAGLADCYSIIGSAIVGTVPSQDVAPKAKAAALKALQWDGSLAEAHTSLATVLQLGPGAEGEPKIIDIGGRFRLPDRAGVYAFDRSAHAALWMRQGHGHRSDGADGAPP